jgi:hypothetical protein
MLTEIVAQPAAPQTPCPLQYTDDFIAYMQQPPQPEPTDDDDSVD